jgi:hypothetical protein
MGRQIKTAMSIGFMGLSPQSAVTLFVFVSLVGWPGDGVKKETPGAGISLAGRILF